jgi:hypothetical protein
VWQDVELSPLGNPLTIIADGTETESDYFVSFLIFDAQKKNCLTDDYPYRGEIIQDILKRMKKIRERDSYYHLFKID